MSVGLLLPALGAAADAVNPPASGGITFVGSDSGFANTGTSIALTLPTHAADDFAVIFAFGDDSAADISITVASGWTELVDEPHSTGRTRRCAIFYKKLTSGAETNPTVTFGSNEQWSASVHVFKGVDATTAFDATYTSDNNINDFTPTAPAITTVTDAACVLTVCGITHDDPTAFVAPSGYTLGESIIGQHHNQGSAYLLDAGAAGVKAPGDWQNTGSGALSEYSVYTLALRAA